MKLVIFGSRGLSPTVEEIDIEVANLLNRPPFSIPVAPRRAYEHITTLISGAARGADLAGELWAGCHRIPIRRFPVRAEKGMSRFQFSVAAKARNRQMANLCDAGLAFWDGDSPGTANMVCHLVDLRKPVLVVRGVKR